MEYINPVHTLAARSEYQMHLVGQPSSIVTSRALTFSFSNLLYSAKSTAFAWVFGFGTAKLSIISYGQMIGLLILLFLATIDPLTRELPERESPEHTQ